MSELQLTATIAPAPQPTRGYCFVISGSPGEKKNFLYTSCKNVIIRSIENPLICDVYAQHQTKASTAEYSPSGFYICSGDASGKVRIWDTVSKDHRLKNEFALIGGTIKSISWSPDSQRIAVCGKGREKHAVVILADSGNTVGKLENLTQANSISYRQTRPFRIAIGQDNFHVNFYEGPPFALKTRSDKHTQFVNCVKYSPDGVFLASCSSDGKVFLYDGKTSELIGQLDEKAHKGGVYSISWSPNSKELMTASADKTVKIWNVEERKEVVKFEMGKEVEDQQLGSLWQGDHLISVSLSGDINYLDRNNPSVPSRVLHGHSKPVSTIIRVPGETNIHISADDSGKMIKCNSATGEATLFKGAGHTNKVVFMFYDPRTNEIISAGWDDKILFTSYSTLDFSAAVSISLESQPKSGAFIGGGRLIVNTEKKLVMIRDKKVVFTLEHDDFIPLAMHAHGSRVVIEAEKNKIVVYDIEGDTLVKSDVSFPLHIRCDGLAFNPDGSKLAVALHKAIRVYVVADGFDESKSKDFTGPSGRILSMEWSPDGDKIMSCSIDCLTIWNTSNRDIIKEKDAHEHAVAKDVAWLDDNNVLSCGDDCLIKRYAVVW